MLFKRDHKIMVFLPRRGGRKLLFTTNVKDESEIQEKVLSELEKYSEDLDIKSYKYVIALDTKTNTEVKVDNPYFEEIEVEKRKDKLPSISEVMEVAYLDIIDKLTSAYSQAIPKIITKTTDITINTIQNMIQSYAEEKSKGSRVRDIAMLISGIVEMAKNWDKVKAMSEELIPKVMDYLKKVSLEGATAPAIGLQSGLQPSQKDDLGGAER